MSILLSGATWRVVTVLKVLIYTLFMSSLFSEENIVIVIHTSCQQKDFLHEMQRGRFDKFGTFSKNNYKFEVFLKFWT